MNREYPECPHCNGQKGYKKMLTPEWHEPPEYEWENCRTCEGQGRISHLKLAIFRARGGPTPITFRGFA